MGSMTTATAPAMRDEAERLLRELAGPDARLREDQWTAIEALVVQRKRALVVQRTGWGKSAVYFISAKLLRAAGHGPHRHRLSVVGPDAKPGQCCRTCRSARRNHQFGQRHRMGRHPCPRRSQ